ncbi:CHASE2 domain-containing protein [Rhizobium sp. ZW T2_16]|uniref:CHASE2 domain-containing protein n=1 Tax=Rhizobium sp. ZW T2_16 TaxID=3378083 RepID=UPI003851EED8
MASRSVQVLLLSVFVFGAVALLSRLPGWALMDYRAFDYLSTIRGPGVPSDDIVIVAIDEPSLAEINMQWPWPRSLHARLVTQLRDAGAKVIGLDIIFSEPSSSVNDQALADAMGPDVVLAADETIVTAEQADQYIRVMPLEIFTSRGAAAGIASISLDRDGAFRRVPAIVDGFAATIAVAGGNAVEVPDEGRLVQVFGGARTYRTVSYYQALDPANFLPPGFFKGRTVIVGLSLQNAPSIASGGADAFATSHTVHDGRLTAGAEIQATILDNLRFGRSVTELRGALTQATVLLSALCAYLLVRRRTGWKTIIGVAAAVLLLAGGSYLALHWAGLFVSPLAPSFAFAGVAAAQATLDYAQERKSRRQITRAFSQYLAPALVAQLAKDPSKLKLGGEKRFLSILFCDVRGFTTISEQLKDDPEQLTALINRLLTPLSQIVLSYGGTIDKYIGDCLMAFWNAPLDDPDHAVHAVSAALDMLASMQTLNDELQHEAEANGRRFFPLRIGIGVNTGECVVGNMGSEQRFDYSALGDAVNLAARLESASKAYGVSLLIGEKVADEIGGIFGVFELDRIAVKGKQEETRVFAATRNRNPSLTKRHKDVLSLHYEGRMPPVDLIGTLVQEVPELAVYYQRMMPEDDQPPVSD